MKYNHPFAIKQYQKIASHAVQRCWMLYTTENNSHGVYIYFDGIWQFRVYAVYDEVSGNSYTSKLVE